MIQSFIEMDCLEQPWYRSEEMSTAEPARSIWRLLPKSNHFIDRTQTRVKFYRVCIKLYLFSSFFKFSLINIKLCRKRFIV